MQSFFWAKEGLKSLKTQFYPTVNQKNLYQFQTLNDLQITTSRRVLGTWYFCEADWYQYNRFSHLWNTTSNLGFLILPPMPQRNYTQKHIFSEIISVFALLLMFF